MNRRMRGERVAEAVYRTMLRLFPSEVRKRHGEEMAQQFGDARRVLAGRPVALLALWFRAALDAAWHGLLERCAIRASVSAGVRRHVVTVTREDSTGVFRRFGQLLAGAVFQDARLAVRHLRRSPSFAVVAALTLALGIGANSAIFSVVYSVLLKPLPFPEPERLVGLFQVWDGERTVFSPPNFLDVQARAATLEAAAAYDETRVVLTNAGEPASFTAAEVTSGFFETLKTRPLLGRTFRRDENEPGRNRVVVLGHALWQQRFGANGDIVGRAITLDAKPYEVVGVMPEEFRFPLRAELWIAVEYDEAFRQTNRAAWFLGAIGRLKPGVGVERAAAELAVLGRQLELEHPQQNAKLGMTAFPLLDSLVGESRRALLVLLATVGVVLLIACANVANLLLARASARENELAVRAALGAGRLDLVRQMIVESLVLAFIGGVAGFLLAAWGIDLLVALRPDAIPRFEPVVLDIHVLAYALAATVLTGITFGILPALQVSRRSLSAALHEQGRSGTSARRSQRIRSALVVAETALAVLLVAGAGLLIRSFVKLSRVDPGFVVHEAVTFSLGLPETSYPDDARRAIFYDELRRRLRTLPGVTGVGSVLAVPPGNMSFNLSVYIKGRPPAAPGEDRTLEVRVADGDYFGVMGIPLRRGRLFSNEDRQGAAPVVLLTERAAREFFPNADPIGAELEVGWRRHGKRIGGRVVGVVGDVKSFGLAEPSPPQLYIPLSQVPIQTMSFVVRTAADASSLTRATREIVRDIDRNLPVNRLKTLEQHVRESTGEQRFYMLLITLFAGVALVLAAVGIFGVLAYLVAQRTREIAVRIALGARPATVVGLVVRRALLLTAVGVALGTLGAVSISRLLEKLLFDLTPTDPMTLVLTGVGLLAVALGAAWIPARRATRVDPALTLRQA